MAEPIPFVQPPRRETDAAARLESAPAEHAEALLSAYELLQLLHDRGVLDLLRGAVGAGGQLVDTATAALDNPASIRGMRNFLLLTKFFGSIPPDVLAGMADAVAAGARCEKMREPPGLLALLWRLRGKDTRRALSVVLDLMESAGRSL